MPETQPSILLIDDNDEDQRVFRAVLGSRDIQLTVAATATDAFRAAAGASYDLIILALGIPGVDTQELRERLRSTLKNARTPVLLMGGNTLLSDAGIATVDAAVLVKPVHAVELQARLDQELRKSRRKGAA